MKARINWVAALLVTGLAAGCATAGHQPGGPDPLALKEAAPPGARPVLHVNNRHWEDLDVWLVRAGTRMRLGAVSAMGAEDFKLPLSISSGEGDFQVLVAPVGESRGYMTEPLLLGAGKTLDLQVDNTLNFTTYSIR
jgi:hypothetical protein